MINIGEEKGAWLRIVADLENELALVRKIENEKDSKISSLQDEIKTLKENAKKFKRENSSERDGGSRGGSRSGTPHRGGEEGGVSRSQEIEAWMDLCNSLSLSKPVFSASGAVHSTTLKSVVDAVKGFRIKQVEKEKIIDQQNSTIKELEEKLTALKDSRAASPSNNNNRKNAHFADESLPLGFSEEEYYAATGRSRSTSQAGAGGAGGGRKGNAVTLSPQSQQALNIAETLSNVMMEGFSRHVLNSLNEKIDFVCSSTSQAIGEPRWRGPKHAEGARWIGTWDNVVAQDQQQPMRSSSQYQQQQQMQGAAAVPPSAQQSSGFPQASQYYTSEQQQSLQAPPRSSSAYNTSNSNQMMMQHQQRGSSPTNWRRVLDSHLGSSYQAQQQQQQNSHLYQQQQNRQIVTSTSSGYGNNSNQNSPFRGHSNNNQMMAMNGYGSSSPTGHHNYVHPHANRPPPTLTTKRPSPPRSTSPLGASQTIRQILERMQAERSSFARSRSGSPQHNNNNNQADFMYSGHHSHQYPFVNRAIRRSQSPPDHRGGGDHQFHQQQQMMYMNQNEQQQRLLPPNNTRFVALPPPMSRMKPGGGRSLTPSGLRSSSALSTQNIYGRYR